MPPTLTALAFMLLPVFAIPVLLLLSVFLRGSAQLLTMVFAPALLYLTMVAASEAVYSQFNLFGELIYTCAFSVVGIYAPLSLLAAVVLGARRWFARSNVKPVERVPDLRSWGR